MLNLKKFLPLLLLNTLMFAENLDNLLEEYQISSDLSNKTLNEKVGHLTIYTQQQLKQMQYNKLSDVLKELPILNQNNNIYGVKNENIAGFYSSISTSMRVFINDHEVSAVQTLSPFLVWESLPLDFISHIEIYTGDSSFSLGNEPGTTFVRVYTKSPYQENGSQLTTTVTSENGRYMGVSHSQVLENKWAFLAYAGTQKQEESKVYKNQLLHNDSDRRYMYLTVQKDNSKIDFGYSDLSKDNFIGLSRDAIPDAGNIKSKDYFVNYSNTFLRDNSLKTVLSIDINERGYEEKNAEGILLLPALYQAGSLPIYFNENLRFEKYDAYVSKTYEQKSNELILASSIKEKKYILEDRTINNLPENDKFNNFNTETLYSIMAEDTYKINDKLNVMADIKLDSYNRNDDLDDSTEHLYKLGLIYMPTDNLGFKLFATQSYIAPTFYYVDFQSPTVSNLKSQKINYYTLENVYTYNSNKFNLILTNIKVDDMIYMTQKGFDNFNNRVEGNSVMFKYTYSIDLKNQLMFNAYTMNSNQEDLNSSSGGNIKYMGSYQKFDYFTALLFKSGYKVSNLNVDDGYDLSAGVTYNYTKNLSFSLKGENLLDNAIKSWYKDYSNNNLFSLADQERTYMLTMKWLF